MIYADNTGFMESEGDDVSMSEEVDEEEEKLFEDPVIAQARARKTTSDNTQATARSMSEEVLPMDEEEEKAVKDEEIEPVHITLIGLLPAKQHQILKLLPANQHWRGLQMWTI